MPSLVDIPTTWPPPAPILLSDSKDQISAVRVTALRPVVVRALAAFIQGSGAGAASTQEGRFAVYTHNAGANRPDALLEESVPFFIGRDDPIRGIEPALLIAPLSLDPGIYWVAIHLAPIVGQGKVQVRGLNSGGRTILQAPALYSSGLPDPFPAGGTAGAGRLGIGGIASGRAVDLTGAIVGTFIVGDGTKVGEGPGGVIGLNDANLVLNGKAFVTNVFTDWHAVYPLKPSLILKAKAVDAICSPIAVVGKPKLTLAAKTVNANVPIFAHMAKSTLLLQGKTFGTPISGIVNPGKGVLFLRGKTVKAGEIALIPSIPSSINLVPSVPQSATLVPSVPQSRDLVPTVEEFR